MQQEIDEKKKYIKTLKDEELIDELVDDAMICGYDTSTPHERQLMETTRTEVLSRLRNRKYPKKT